MFIVDDNGDITLVQGDSGQLVLNGLPVDKNYTVYCAVQDSNRKPVGFEINVKTNNQPTVALFFSPSLTDNFTVKKTEDYAEYYYSVKLCYEEDLIEDTLLLGNKALGENNTITVYPKKVEGTV